MQNERKTLSIRTPPRDATAPDGSTDATALVRAAISRGLRVAATYNRARVEIAPHILYTKHDDPFVDGVVLERDGKPPKEIKLGTFKLAGLSDLTLAARSFVPFAGFDPAAERYAGTTLATLRR